MTKRYISSVLLFSAAFVLTVFFQNCGSPHEGTEFGNNGEVYDGKPGDVASKTRLMPFNCVVALTPTQKITFDLRFDKSDKQIIDGFVQDGVGHVIELSAEDFIGRTLRVPIALSEDLVLSEFTLDGSHSAMESAFTTTADNQVYSRRKYCNRDGIPAQ